ncbi:MAG: hypothetical protein QOK02_6550 [Mycobacterium sp.]|nr:hypothetical protein [Mycobacterium sp.]
MFSLAATPLSRGAQSSLTREGDSSSTTAAGVGALVTLHSLPPGFTMPSGRAMPFQLVDAGSASSSTTLAPGPYPDHPGWPVAVVGATSPPVAADLDPAYPGLEVVVGTLNSGPNLYVFHADGTVASGWPIDVGTFVAGSPAVGDIDGDGDLEVVASDFGSNQVVAFHYDGTPVAGWPRPVLANVRSTPALADLDPAFPGLEIIVGVQDGTVWAWHHDGSLVPGWPVLAGNFVERCSPTVGDVDGDGDLEVFVGSYYNGIPGVSTGGMYAFKADGSPLPGWPQLTGSGTSIVASPVLVDLDHDGDLEIVAGTYETDGRIFVWHHDGTLMAGWPQPVPRGVSSFSGMTSSPAVGDIDGDCDLEIVTGSPAQCGTVYAWHADGSLVAGWPQLVISVVDGSSPVLGDVDGDGGVDVVIGSGSGFTPLGCAPGTPSLAYVFHGDGTLATGWPYLLGTATPPHPALADLDQNGSLDLLFAFAETMFAWETPAQVVPLLLQWPFFHFDIEHTGLYRQPGCAPPIPTAVVSRKTHGADDFDINLPLTGTPGIECRQGQGTNSDEHRVVFTFSAPATVASATCDGNSATTTTSGNDVTVNCTAVPNGKIITVALTGVTVEADSGNVSVPIGVLVGDTNADGVVNSSDIAQTKSQSGHNLTSSNFREDLSVDGSLNSGDIALVKSKSGTALP